MKSIIRAQNIRIAGMVCAAAALAAACAEAPPPPKAVQAPPSVGLPSKVVQAATAYEAYVDKASAITAEFPDGETVGQKLRQGAAYEAEQFQRGQAAYAAIVALQDPAFVAGVRAYTTDPAARTQLVADIVKDPAYVIGVKGSDSAAGLVIAALDAQGQRLKGAGEKVRQAAYDVQKQSWSKAVVKDREARLAAVKTLSSTPMIPTVEQNARLQMASTGQAPLALAGSAASPPYTPLVVRSLAAAALAVLGEGREANSDFMWAVLNEPNQALCLNLAKMNLNQCLAVAKPHYEDVFCLGVHSMMDTGACIIKGAGAPERATAIVAAAPAAMTPIAGAAPHKTP